MSALAGIFLYWAVVLVVLVEVRRELVDRAGNGRPVRGGVSRLLYGALTIAALGAVVLTAVGLRAGG